MPSSRTPTPTAFAAAAIALCLALPAIPVAAQAPAWVQFAPPATVGLHVRDSRRDREIFFDGQGLLAVPDRSTIEWQRIWSGTNPASPQRDRAFYDPTQDRIWTVTSTLTDTLQLWFMDLSSEPMQWVRQSCAWPDSGEMFMDPAFAFDPVRDRIVTFGGYAVAYPFPLHCNQCGGQTNAVFTLTLGGTPTWTRETVQGPAPVPRESAAMVYDPWRDRMLEYGGVSYGPIYYDETWALSSDSTMHWSQLNPTRLPPTGHSPTTALLDSLGQRWIVDGWALDLSASVSADAADWTQLPPASRSGGVSAWFEQAAQSRIVIYEGTFLLSLSIGSTPTWSLLEDIGRAERFRPVSFVDAARERVYAGLGIGQELGGELEDSFKVRPLDRDQPWTPVPTTGPSARLSAVAAVDAVGRRALVFGGGDETTGQIDGDEFSDLWAFNLDTQQWSLLASGNPPIPRTEALGVFDTAHRRLIVHGGRYTNPSAVALSDTWVFDVAAGTWSSPPTGNYGGVWGELGVYDPVRDRVISFGGVGAGSGGTRVLPLGPTIGTWTELATAGTAPNATALYHAAAYDPLGDRVIVVGEKAPGSVTVWALTLSEPATWSELTPSGEPPPSRYGAQLVSDPERGRVILVGGSPVYWGRNQASDPSASDDWALYLQDLPAGSLMSANFAAGAVTLRWHASESGAGATVYRRGDGADWQDLGRQAADASGLVTWSDRDVVGGASYDYRLDVFSPRGERVFGETHVDVPVVATPSQLSLEGLRPNPTNGPLVAAFSLAEGGETTLELIDVAGRRVLYRDLGYVGPGPHTARLDAGGPHLESGLYFVRMHHAGQVLSKRAVLSR